MSKRAEPKRTIDIQPFLEQLAAALTTDGEQWSVVPETYPDSLYRTITTQIGDPDRFGLNITFDNQNDRITISPVPSEGIDLQGKRFSLYWNKPEIGINATRPIQAVAADIRRRLIPDARGWWADQCIQAARSRADYAAVVQFQQDLQTIFPEGRMRDGSVFSGPHFTVRTASSTYDARIEFDSRPRDEIIRLLTLYRQHILKQGDFSYGR